MIALVDCNNFYASCERVFNPALRRKPVVVLSNNDGCIIARSNEAKAAGIGMGDPIFKYRRHIADHRIHVYSANFVLYGDMSRRVMSTLFHCVPDMEIYSIDEAFLNLDGTAQDPVVFMAAVRERIRRDTGLPVSVGIASTKTLAKIANRIAKKESAAGVFPLIEPAAIDRCLEQTDVQDIWGIGREKADLLRRHGIAHALQLKMAPDAWVKKHLTITTLKTVWELRGISCMPLEDVSPDKKGIGTSRTFSRDVADKEVISQAIAAYTAMAAAKLREQRSVCGYLQVYIATNRFREGRSYSNAAGIDLTPATAYTPDLITAAERLFQRIYRPDFSYKRAGVLLSNLHSMDTDQQFLFEPTYINSRKQRLMDVVDGINRKSNTGKVFMASEGVQAPGRLEEASRSKRYTTRWDEVLEVHI